MDLMTIAPFIPTLLLLPLLVLGIVLFIAGSLRKKPAMWGISIPVVLLSLAALVVGTEMCIFIAPQPQGAKPLDFHGITGLYLPKDVHICQTFRSLRTKGEPNDSTPLLVLEATAPARTKAFFAAHCTKAQWSTAARAFRVARRREYSFLPSDSRLQGMSLYSLTTQPDPNSPTTFTTFIAHDANQNMAWLVSVSVKGG